MKQIDVCLSPELIHLYDLSGKIVVVVDILRATSCITTGLAYGVEAIKPIATLEECKSLKDKGYLTAAERGGQMVPTFDMGNSPFSYMEQRVKGKKIGMTTTNGTLTITKSKAADEVIIGSFLNLTAVAEYLQTQNQDVIIHCAGWQGRVNLEDTLYAGALVEKLGADYQVNCDAARAAVTLYKEGKKDLDKFLSQSSHVQRLKKFNIQKDITFCLTIDEYAVVPVLRDDELVRL
jgi:2-phosphosulfolactate phosphatase